MGLLCLFLWQACVLLDGHVTVLLLWSSIVFVPTLLNTKKKVEHSYQTLRPSLVISPYVSIITVNMHNFCFDNCHFTAVVKPVNVLVPCVRRKGLAIGRPSTEHWFPHGYNVMLPAWFSM